MNLEMVQTYHEINENHFKIIVSSECLYKAGCVDDEDQLPHTSCHLGLNMVCLPSLRAPYANTVNNIRIS